MTSYSTIFFCKDEEFEFEAFILENFRCKRAFVWDLVVE